MQRGRARLYVVPDKVPHKRTVTKADQQWLRGLPVDIEEIVGTCAHVTVRSNLRAFAGMIPNFEGDHGDFVTMVGSLEIALRILRSANHPSTESVFRVMAEFNRRFK